MSSTSLISLLLLPVLLLLKIDAYHLHYSRIQQQQQQQLEHPLRLQQLKSPLLSTLASTQRRCCSFKRYNSKLIHFASSSSDDDDDDDTSNNIANQTLSTTSSTSSTTTTSSSSTILLLLPKKRKTLNTILASITILLTLLHYLYRSTHPLTDLQILSSLQSTSTPLHQIGTNGKPTLIDFWAPWCENCRVMAPTLRAVEEEYHDRINFVSINGDERNGELVELFGVDSIPHLALVDEKGYVETALVGLVPRSVLRADFDVMLENASGGDGGDGLVVQGGGSGGDDGNVVVGKRKELPHVMYNAFGNRPNERVVHFD